MQDPLLKKLTTHGLISIVIISTTIGTIIIIMNEYIKNFFKIRVSNFFVIDLLIRKPIPTITFIMKNNSRVRPSVTLKKLNKVGSQVHPDSINDVNTIEMSNKYFFIKL